MGIRTALGLKRPYRERAGGEAAHPVSNAVEPGVDEATRLANLYGSDKGSEHFGRHHYTRVYSEYFSPIRHQHLRVLEIGLLHLSATGWDDPTKRNAGATIGRRAPSLEMWADYFPNSHIVGFDINEFQGVDIPRCTVIRGNMSSRHDLARLADGSAFDIIIDDASHASHHQQIALGFLFPLLKNGGTYWIEDLNYQPPDLEIEGAVKTAALLHQLVYAGQFPSEFISSSERAHLEQNAAVVELYDSLGAGARHHRDSLAVITKT